MIFPVVKLLLCLITVTFSELHMCCFGGAGPCWVYVFVAKGGSSATKGFGSSAPQPGGKGLAKQADFCEPEARRVLDLHGVLWGGVP